MVSFDFCQLKYCVFVVVQECASRALATPMLDPPTHTNMLTWMSPPLFLLLQQKGQYDGPVSVYVAPTVVPYTHLLASARGSGNAVAVTSANMGTCSYTGPGAGRFPTANSIVSDVVRVAKKQAMIDPFPIQSNLDLDPNFVSAHYIRIPFQDSLGIIRTIGELAEEHGISIHAILQNPIADKMSADFCITTEDCNVSQVDGFCAAVAKEDFCRSPPLSMPLLMEL
jgi:hypothetical protein